MDCPGAAGHSLARVSKLVWEPSFPSSVEVSTFQSDSVAESFTSLISYLSTLICGLYDTGQLSEVSATLPLLLYLYIICLSRFSLLC